MEFAPLRSLDDFILGQARFQVPDTSNEDRWLNRIYSNLLYYQTNYLLTAAGIFGLVFFLHPRDMAYGIFVMVVVFGLAYYLQRQTAEVQQFRRTHPLMFSTALFCSGCVLVYLLGCVVVLMLGVCLPVLFALLHASLRLRNVRNKLSNVAEAAGLTKKTPMAALLAEMGVEHVKIN